MEMFGEMGVMFRMFGEQDGDGTRGEPCVVRVLAFFGLFVPMFGEK
jgi:hypothetical protein